MRTARGGKSRACAKTSFMMGPEGEGGLGAAAWILWIRDEDGSFEKVSYGGCVQRSASAMTAEREALRMGIEHLTVFCFRQGFALSIFELKIQVGQFSTN